MPIIKTNILVKSLALFCCSGVLLLSIFYSWPVEASFVKQINYQGKLTNADGEAVADANYSIVFKLYDAPTGGSTIWTETNSVSTKGGLFSVMLGANTSLETINFNQALYLSLNVNNDGEMSPRKVLGAVPNAFNAEELAGLPATSFLRADIANATATITNLQSSILSVAGISTLATTTLSFDSTVGGGDRYIRFNEYLMPEGSLGGGYHLPMIRGYDASSPLNGLFTQDVFGIIGFDGYNPSLVLGGTTSTAGMVLNYDLDKDIIYLGGLVVDDGIGRMKSANQTRIFTELLDIVASSTDPSLFFSFSGLPHSSSAWISYGSTTGLMSFAGATSGYVFGLDDFEVSTSSHQAVLSVVGNDYGLRVFSPRYGGLFESGLTLEDLNVFSDGLFPVIEDMIEDEFFNGFGSVSLGTTTGFASFGRFGGFSYGTEVGLAGFSPQVGGLFLGGSLEGSDFSPGIASIFDDYINNSLSVGIVSVAKDIGLITIAKDIGLFISASSSNHAIYAETGMSYFGDSVGIGTSTPDFALVVGSGNLDQGLRSIQIPYGGLCVDDDGWCEPTVAGKISAVSYATEHSDLAENYQAFEIGLSPGDIITFTDLSDLPDGEPVDIFGLRKARQQNEVVGIISTTPGITLGSLKKGKSDDQLPVALTGRVPVKVNLEGGEIKVGDQIVLSTVPGVGARATSSLVQTVGIALESFNSRSPKDENNIGKIIVFVNLGLSRLDPSIAGGQIKTTDFWGLDATTGRIKIFTPLDLANTSLENVQAITSASGSWRISAGGELLIRDVKISDSLELGSPDKRIGITLYDQQTGEPYCLFIEAGIVRSLNGKCQNNSSLISPPPDFIITNHESPTDLKVGDPEAMTEEEDSSEKEIELLYD